MVTGKYKIYLDGKLVREQENSLSFAGRAILLKSIMGLLPTVGGSIQMGISSIPNSFPDPNLEGLITNTRLDFAVAQATVELSYLDNSGGYDAMVFKSTVTGGEAYDIYELGLFPYKNQENFKDIVLFTGGTSDLWKKVDQNNSVLQDLAPTEYNPAAIATSYMPKTSASSNGYQIRSGNQGVFIKPGDRAMGVPVQIITAPDSTDTLSIAYSKKAGSSPVINARFNLDNGGYYSATFPAIASSSQFGIANIYMKANSLNGVNFVGTNTNNLGIERARSLTLYVTGTGNDGVVIDSIRINKNGLSDNVRGMVSRAVLSSPITKANNEQLDIEYYLSIGFNKTVES